MHIGDIIRKAREQQGITQSQLASQSGYPEANLCRLEKYGGDPKLSTLLRFSGALGLSVGDLIAPLDHERADAA